MSSTALSESQTAQMKGAEFAARIQAVDRGAVQAVVRAYLGQISEARREVKRDRGMDAIEEVVEERFSSDGHWQRPPRPMDLQLQDAEIGQAIDGCLEHVSTQQRFAFALREVLGFTTEEVCNILEVTRTLGAGKQNPQSDL